MARACQRCNQENAEDAKFCFHCGAMLETAADDSAHAQDSMIGRVLLNRYRTLSVLGEGGMGKVYLAEQKMGTATRKVAIKTLHTELGNDPQLVARFHRESETVIGLTHPNTIQFYDFGELEDGTLFIVMEYIKGESLAHVLERGALDVRRVDKILIQICGSLAEAHKLGVVHRDLKPENVLLTNRGGHIDFVKVLDFGIAKRNEAEDEKQARLTKQGMVLGTPPYMSPEQFSGQALDARSDVYSLGVMTYEMLCGALPFEAKTPWEWATKHLTEEPRTFESFPDAAQVPERKKQAVIRSLRKDRQHRQATVTEFLQEFAGVGDPHAAWAMATSGAFGAGGAETGATTGEARRAVGTPEPMPETGASPALSTAEAQQAVLARSRSGRGLLVAFGVVGLFVLTGGLAGGLYFMANKDNASVADSDATAREGRAGSAGDPSSGNPSSGDPSSGDPSSGQTPTAVPSTPGDDSSDKQQGEPSAPPEATKPEDMKPGDAPSDTKEPEAETESTSTKRRPASARTRRVNQAKRARGQRALENGRSALQNRDVNGAVAGLAAAQSALGRRDPGVKRFRSELARKAGNRVGILIQQGKCGQAQQLYRKLKSVGAEGGAAQHFSDWCPRP